MDNLLEIKNLTVELMSTRGIVYALSGVDLTIRPGEIHGVVGESGCGKSMTAKSILRLHNPQRSRMNGSIRFEDKELLSLSNREMEKLRGTDISMIFQDPMTSLNPLMTIGDQIADMYRFHTGASKSEGQEKAQELLAKVGIEPANKRCKQYPFELSGGMQQRVMIAMSIACSPKLLIADEPTTALDVTIQAQILELMKDLQKKTHMGIIFITHNLGVVAEICDKVSVMYAGRIVEQGPVDDIFYHPSHPYTLGLLRSMPRVDAESYERLIPIEGTPVDMLNPPEGCPFAPRCDKAMKICLQKMPPYVEVGENHCSACWLRVQEQIEAKKKEVDDRG